MKRTAEIICLVEALGPQWPEVQERSHSAVAGGGVRGILRTTSHAMRRAGTRASGASLG